MKIVIDMSPTLGGSRYRGIGAYMLALVEAILKKNDGHDLHFVMANEYPVDFFEELRTFLLQYVSEDHIHVWTPFEKGVRGGNQDPLKCHLIELYREAYIRHLNPDVVLISSFFDDAVTSVDRFSVDVPVATIHYDLIPLAESRGFLSSSEFARLYLERLNSFKLCKAFLCISEFTKNELVAMLGVEPKRTFVVGTGCDIPQFNIAESSDMTACRQKFGLTKKYILVVGSPDDPRKNVKTLIRAMGKLQEKSGKEYQLLVVGRCGKDFREKIQSDIYEAGLKNEDVILTGFVSELELEKLYQGASLLVHPSYREGFGLPIAQAMAYGTPFACSNTSCMPEVAGRNDVLFSPYSEVEMADVMYRILSSNEFSHELIAYGMERVKMFSWEVVANKVISSLQCIANKQPNEKISMDEVLCRMKPLVVLLSQTEQVALCNALARDFSTISEASVREK